MWSDKLLQEVIRAMLEAYDEPQFSDPSHGFRPRQGCHTALTKIHKTWSGTKGCIEGDIRGCFDHIDHTIVRTILREQLHDNRVLRLIAGLLKAGSCEAWTDHPTLSGTPQGGVVSPMLSNIDLDRLDRFVMGTLIPEYTRGKTRKAHPASQRLSALGQYYRKTHRPELAERLRRQSQDDPWVDPHDPDYRRLR
jgi:retron-type reverse transcriptase